MNLEQTVEVACPYCGGVFTTFVDTSQGGYSEIEDCQGCCRPMQITVACGAGEIDFIAVERA